LLLEKLLAKQTDKSKKTPDPFSAPNKKNEPRIARIARMFAITYFLIRAIREIRGHLHT
jgi:hypothetical protein